MRQRRHRSLLLLLASLGAGCSSEAPSPSVVERPVTPPAPSLARAEAIVDPYAPLHARDGRLRIIGEALEQDAGAAAELLRRLDAGGASELRVAQVEALPRTRGPWQAEALARLGAERDPAVRKMWVAILGRADPDVAVRGMALGLGDDEPAVRAEAAILAGALPAATLRDGGFEALLGDHLEDAAAEVRAGAARSLGILGFAEMFAAIRPLLGDADANVRLQALRALVRLDRAAARALPELAGLRDDPDTRVARAVARLAQPQ